MRQEEDVGTQYRSVIHTFGAQQRDSALKSKAMYQQAGLEQSLFLWGEPGCVASLMRYLVPQ